jgi:hypothetical protein
MFQSKCKICRAGLSGTVSYLRYYRCFKQAAIAEYLSELTGNEFNVYNVSNHLNFHVEDKDKRVYQSLKTKYPDESCMSLEFREAFHKYIRRY